MRRCDSCCREFTGRSRDCPWCGYCNAPGGSPRSARSLAELDRRQQEALEEELAELAEDMAICLGWEETAERRHLERASA